MLIGKIKEDFGCGDLVGVDISPHMVSIARANEESNPLGITYHVSDVQHLGVPEKKFDLVVALYLLHYAKTSDELDHMVQVISEQLKDNDKAYFLTINGNVCGGEKIYNTDRYLKYGYRGETQIPLVDGAQVKNIHFNSDGSSFSYTTYYISPHIYEQAFKKAGFKYFEWVPMIAAPGSDKYNDYFECPGTTGILAHK
jgi:SAM-dependent methyltransferase